MFRNASTAFIILALFFGLSACGKKKEVEDVQTATETEASEIVPGEMVFVPAGDFIMGSEDPKSDGYPKHTVNLPAYWIDKYEVTNAEYLDFSLKTGYQGEGVKEGKDWRIFFTPATPEKAMIPVVYITWNDATAYCKSLGKRLPTEEEWEKAARGTDGRKYPWGNDWMDNRSNTYEAGIVKPDAIGRFDDVSPYGAHDMLGNVQEWTDSWFASYKGNPNRNPKSGKTLRVLRGQGPNHKAKMGSLADRAAWPPEYLANFGFRCAKNATPEDEAKAAHSK